MSKKVNIKQAEKEYFNNAFDIVVKFSPDALSEAKSTHNRVVERVKLVETQPTAMNVSIPMAVAMVTPGIPCSYACIQCYRKGDVTVTMGFGLFSKDGDYIFMPLCKLHDAVDNNKMSSKNGELLNRFGIDRRLMEADGILKNTPRAKGGLIKVRLLKKDFTKKPEVK